MREYRIHGYDIETGGFFGPPDSFSANKGFLTKFGARREARKIQEENEMLKIFITGPKGSEQYIYTAKAKK